MRTLIVEDDFAVQQILDRYLKPFGQTSIVDTGIKAVKIFQDSIQAGMPYDLVCLDIMLPGKNGQEVLKDLRSFEESQGIFGLKGVKVIMITALYDAENIMKAFREQCESYIPKPVRYERLVSELENLGLLPPGSPKNLF